MAVNYDIRAELEDETIVFDNPAFDNSIIGITTDGQAVYSYNLMVKELMEDEDLSEQDAVDWIEYNTLRAIPYAGPMAPIVMFMLEEVV